MWTSYCLIKLDVFLLKKKIVLVGFLKEYMPFEMKLLKERMFAFYNKAPKVINFLQIYTV